MGVGDRLTIRRTRVERVLNMGHLIKSRARVNVIEDSKFLGLDGPDSREWEFPCGGDITVRRSVFQKGQQSDNAESGGVGIEMHWPHTCGVNAGQPTTFRFTDNWLIFDRTGGMAGGNSFGKWRSAPVGDGTNVRPIVPGENAIVERNKIVQMWSWGEFPVELDALNQRFANRAAAGLGAEEVP
jgi:hypothetical protein